MRALEYKGGVQTYLAKLEEINTRIGMTGEALKDTVVNSITPEMHRNIYLRYRRLPENDADLLEAVREVGLFEEDSAISAVQIR